MDVKEFKDLIFHSRKRNYINCLFGLHPDISQCVVLFPNNYGISIITGGYGNEESPYECAEVKHNLDLKEPEDGYSKEFKLTYENYSDVIGYCDEKKVMEILEEIRNRNGK